MTARQASAARPGAERLFFGGMGILILLLVFAGFAPTYFLRGMIDVGRPLPPMTPLIQLHGLIFSAWILLFVTQAALISARRHGLHRRLGGIAIALAVAMVVIGLLTAIGQVTRGSGLPGIPPLVFLAIPVFALPSFAGLVAAGYAWRRDPQTHKRLMLVATINMLQPAFGRFPWPPDVLNGELGTLVAFSMVLPLIAWDLATRGRPHRATLAGIGILAAEQLIRIAVWRTEGWLSCAAWLVATLG